MTLPATDTAYLNERNIDHEVISESGMTCVVLPSWPLPPGFSQPASDLLVRLSPGYPDIAPDMWWFNPAIRLADDTELPATQVTEQHLGRTWQRWSRHLTRDQWQSGVDGLESFLALIRRDLERCVPERAQ